MVRRDLNHRQHRFVAEYVVDGNATTAAIKAGYSKNGARQKGADLLANPAIAASIERARTALQIRTGINQDKVLAELGRLAFSDVTHYEVDDFGNLAPAEGAPEGVMRAVSSIKRRTILDGKGNVIGCEVDFRLWDKPGALKLAGRHVGLFPGRDKEAIEALATQKLQKMIAQARAAQAAAEAEAQRQPFGVTAELERDPVAE